MPGTTAWRQEVDTSRVLLARRNLRHPASSALVNEFAEADANRRLSSVIARYSKIGLLCLDEFGDLNLDRKGAKLLFQIFTEREERKATAVWLAL